jgi:hypothetical protein
MNLIQIFLIGGFIGCFAIYAKFFRSALFDRVIALLLLSVAIFFVIFPDATVFVAQLLGVGRGTDLVLYIFIVLFSFLALLFYSKLHRLQRVQTELARAIAIRDARKP